MPFTALLADAAAPDAATAALGGWGALANLTCLAFVLVVSGYEALWGKARREDKQQAHIAARDDKQQAHIERIAAEFRAETREQRTLQLQVIESLRADSRAIADRTTEAMTQLASSVQSLRLDLRSHGTPTKD
jgi:hypothetical protein